MLCVLSLLCLGQDLIKRIILTTTGYDAVNHAVKSRLIDQLTVLFRGWKLGVKRGVSRCEGSDEDDDDEDEDEDEDDEDEDEDEDEDVDDDEDDDDDDGDDDGGGCGCGDDDHGDSKSEEWVAEMVAFHTCMFSESMEQDGTRLSSR